MILQSKIIQTGMQTAIQQLVSYRDRLFEQMQCLATEYQQQQLHIYTTCTNLHSSLENGRKEFQVLSKQLDNKNQALLALQKQNYHQQIKAENKIGIIHKEISRSQRLAQSADHSQQIRFQISEATTKVLEKAQRNQQIRAQRQKFQQIKSKCLEQKQRIIILKNNQRQFINKLSNIHQQIKTSSQNEQIIQKQLINNKLQTTNLVTKLSVLKQQRTQMKLLLNQLSQKIINIQHMIVQQGMQLQRLQDQKSKLLSKYRQLLIIDLLTKQAG